ncbi:MAG: histidine kinase, partial [Flavobacteriales bacterium]
MELWNRHFGKYSKWLAYALIALLIATIEGVDDVIDQDNKPIDIIIEFFFICGTLSIIFPLLGGFYNWTIDKSKVKLSHWKFPILLISIAWIFLNIGLKLGISYIYSIASCTEFGVKMDMVFIVSLLLVITFENFWNLIHNKVQLELKNAELIKNHEKAKYQALLNQIDPHFLFNNLNILSYLVHENANKADQFILELGNIYRYILQLNASYLIPLHKELDFINSYIFLLSIRFRDNL